MSQDKENKPYNPRSFGVRHQVALMAFLGYVVTYTLRIDLSLAIVAMVKTHEHNETLNGTCTALMTNQTSEDNQNLDGEFDWTSEEQGVILGAFFWGYSVTQLPFGMLATRYGARWVFCFGIFFAAVFHMLIPVAARAGKIYLIICRIFQGFAEGAVPPCAQSLIGQWAPPGERSRIGAFIMGGIQFGTMVTLLLSGVILNANIFGGWPAVFYIFAMGSIVWCFLWAFIGYSKPSEHPRISQGELDYILNSMGNQVSKVSVRTPWKKIFTSLPFFAVVVAQLAQGWGLYTLLTALPTYMSNVLKYNIRDNSLLSALPYGLMFLMAFFGSFLADYLRKREYLSTNSTRKIFNTAAFWIPAAALVGASFSGCDRTLTVGLLTLGVAFNGCVCVGHLINHMDIAPNHSGVLMGISSGLSNLMGIVTPYITGIIIKSDEGSVDNWRWVFIIAAIYYFIGNLVFIMFGKGEEQTWNRPKNLQNSQEKIVQTIS